MPKNQDQVMPKNRSKAKAEVPSLLQLLAKKLVKFNPKADRYLELTMLVKLPQELTEAYASKDCYDICDILNALRKKFPSDRVLRIPEKPTEDSEMLATLELLPLGLLAISNVEDIDNVDGIDDDIPKVNKEDRLAEIYGILQDEGHILVHQIKGLDDHEVTLNVFQTAKISCIGRGDTYEEAFDNFIEKLFAQA